MNILVVGAGGREHALVKALKLSSHVKRIWVWPGNDGIFQDAEPVPIQRNHFQDLSGWCLQQNIDLVVIGPEAELVAGLSDQLRSQKINVFGPSKEASMLEGSKIFAKEFMNEFDVPTSRSDVVTSVKQTLECATKYTPPYVLKADGLAAGKGVFICEDLTELENSAKKIFNEKLLGAAGERALLEQFQPGSELSVLILTNGQSYVWLPLCRDHKRLQDGDRGPNTGGMGVVGPLHIDSNLKAKIEKEILDRSVAGLRARNFLFRGVLFVGIMVTPEGPQVLEYNVRFGDPETQVIMPQLQSDWAEALAQIARGNLPNMIWRNDAVACVVMAAEGYPNNPVSGVPIEGLTKDNAEGVQVLHAGTRRESDKFVTNGGRVLNIVARGSTLNEALSKAYAKVRTITWPGVQYRTDIGKNLETR